MPLSERRFQSFWLVVAAAIFMFCGLSAVAQSPSAGKVPPKRNLGVSAPAPLALPTEISAVLADLASRAAVIFTGQVLAVTSSAGVVDVQFQVENSIRNCPQKGNYVLREWAGLWTAHPDRYRVGQHVLLFLTARGSAGLSAPVDVNDGIVPLVATAQQPIADASGTAPPDTPSSGLTVDLRWLQTRVIRPPSTPTLLNPSSAASSAGKAWVGPVTPLASVPPVSLISIIALIGNEGSNAQI